MTLPPGLLPYVLILFAGAVWGITFSLARIATEDNAHPLGINLWQAVIGAVVLLLVCYIRRKWPRRDWASIRRYVVIAFTGTVFPGTLYFYAASNLPAGIMALTIAAVPLFTYLASLILGSDYFSARRVTGLLLGIIGLVLLSRPEVLPERSALPWLGVALMCAVFYTIENLYVDNTVPAETDMVCTLTGAFMFATLFLVPLTFFVGAFFVIEFPLDRIDWSVIAMALITVFSYLIFLVVIQSSGAVFASMMGYIITVSGVLWGMLIFNERHSLLVWVVLLLLVAGMALVKPIDKALAE